MRVGVPKEIKNNEFRVGMTSGAVREYVAHGHKVMVQPDAEVGIKATDDDYKAAGASIAPDAKTIFDENDMIVKVKEPSRLNIPSCAKDRSFTPTFTSRPIRNRPKAC